MIGRMSLGVMLVLALVMIDTAAPALRGDVGVAFDAAAQEAPIDLAWLAPGPEDFSIDGYGLTYGVYHTAASEGVSVYGNPGPLTAYDEAYHSTAARQSYFQMVSLRSDDDPDVVARQVTVVFAEFGDVGDAETGFRAVSEVFTTHERTRTPPEVGDEALALRGEFTSSDGRTYQELRILVRTGRFLTDLVIDDYMDDAPAMSEFLPLAELVAERLESATSSEGPRLGVQVARFAGEQLTGYYDYYTRREGDEVPIEGELPSQRQSDDEFFDETGTRDSYYYVTEALPTDEDPTLVSLIVDFRRFSDEASAAAHLETAVENWTEAMGTAYRDVAIADDLEVFGDGSVAVSYTHDSTYGPIAGYRIWVHAGERVAAVELGGIPAISLGLAVQMAEAQQACLEETECMEPLPVAEFMPGESDTSAAGTPETGGFAKPS